MDLTPAQPVATGGNVGHAHMLSDAQFSGRSGPGALAPHSQSITPDMAATAPAHPAGANGGWGM